MEAILGLPTSTSAEASSRPLSLWLPSRGGARLQRRPSRLHLKPPWGGGGGGRRPYTLVVEAKRKRRGGSNTNVNKKPLLHSAVPTPGESTWFFPEADVLKKKEVREDGKVLPEFADAEEEKRYEFLTLQRESALKLQQMRHYEVIYLIHQDNADNADEVESISTKIQDFVRERKGRIYRLNHWGLRRLAYKIKKTTKAYYILLNFELEAKSINDFKNMLERDERIIRHLVIKRKHAITEYCPPPPEFHTLRESMVDEDDEYDDDDNGVVNVDGDEDDEEYDDEDDEEYEDEYDEEYDDEDDAEYEDEEDVEYDNEEDAEQEDEGDAEHEDEGDPEHENKDDADNKDKDNAIVVDDEDEEVASPKGTKTLVAKMGKR